ncbi:MAG: glycerophosphodiester phosphodiesterase [Chloroherpetonaceae bacterium]|nr:glycerophosphodiester phosphodiesterase [Chloroherpetonaceae bacterium]MCS7210511.1 glycerophosphodiester phosphodiesterase [Chloroherpetonaceae bacterium]
MTQAPQRRAFDLQGHRGARGLLPENTIPAFLKALEYGVTTLECDVVISKDRRVVVSHEPWFSHEISTAPSGKPVEKSEEKQFNIYEMTYDEILRFDVGKRGHARFPKQQAMPAIKPLLSEVFREVEAYCLKHNLPPVRFNIEIKSTPEGDGKFHPSPEEFAQLLYKELYEAGMLTRATVQSFDVRALQAMRAIDSTVTLALLVDNTLSLNENLWQLGFTPDIYSPYYRLVTPELVEEVHKRRMKLIPWTVNDLDEMKCLLDMGVDGIITDYPDVASTLHQR